MVESVTKTAKSFVHFPLLFVLLLGGGFWVCYGIAVSNKHVVLLPEWPFVSDTGATPPESCIFTLVLTWGAFFILLTMYSYYKYVIYCDKQSKCNIAAMIVGTVASFGVTMVGAFQWTNVLVPHLIGAALAFFGAAVYSVIVVYISWNQLVPNVHTRKVVYLRIAIVVMEIVSLVVMIVGGILFQIDKKYRNIASAAEWALIYAAIIFVGTLAYDLRHIRGATVRLQIPDMESANVPLGDVETTYSSTGASHQEL